MSDWNEDNFFERLTPQLRRKLRGENGPCPDADTLCAVIEGAAAGPERESVIAHVSGCHVCADVGNRLLKFERASEHEPEVGWNQSRIRLDNWLEGFLRSEAARFRSAQPAKPSWIASARNGVWDFVTSMKIVWALSAVLAVVVTVDGFLFLRYRRDQLSLIQVATRPAAPPKPPVISVPAQKPAERSEGKRRLARNGTGKPRPPVALIPPTAPWNPNPLGQMAQTLPPPPTEAASPPTPPAQSVPTETAQATVPSPAYPSGRGVGTPSNPHLGGPPGASSRAGAAPPNARGPSGPFSAGLHASPRATVSRPSSIWLDPGSRLLIVLSSIEIKPDGSFQFHAKLLLPVAQPAVLLDRGAEVIGGGKISQGQTSVAVTEFVVQGVRYALKEGSGAMNAETPGAGGGVHFDRSQVLDMWPTDTATYEKVSDPAGQTEAPK